MGFKIVALVFNYLFPFVVSLFHRLISSLYFSGFPTLKIGTHLASSYIGRTLVNKGSLLFPLFFMLPSVLILLHTLRTSMN